MHSKKRIVILTINLLCWSQMSEPIWCMDTVNWQDGMKCGGKLTENEEKLTCSYPPHSNDFCSLIWIQNNKELVIMTISFLQCVHVPQIWYWWPTLAVVCYMYTCMGTLGRPMKWTLIQYTKHTTQVKLGKPTKVNYFNSSAWASTILFHSHCNYSSIVLFHALNHISCSASTFFKCGDQL